MNPILEFCVTLLAVYGVSYYIITPTLTCFFAIIIVLYNEWDQKTTTKKQGYMPIANVLIAIIVFPVVYGILPSEFKIVFWQGIPTLLTFLMFATGATAIKIIINRKVNRKEET